MTTSRPGKRSTSFRRQRLANNKNRNAILKSLPDFAGVPLTVLQAGVAGFVHAEQTPGGARFTSRLRRVKVDGVCSRSGGNGKSQRSQRTCFETRLDCSTHLPGYAGLNCIKPGDSLARANMIQELADMAVRAPS